MRAVTQAHSQAQFIEIEPAHTTRATRGGPELAALGANALAIFVILFRGEGARTHPGHVNFSHTNHRS